MENQNQPQSQELPTQPISRVSRDSVKYTAKINTVCLNELCFPITYETLDKQSMILQIVCLVKHLKNSVNDKGASGKSELKGYLKEIIENPESFHGIKETLIKRNVLDYVYVCLGDLYVFVEHPQQKTNGLSISSLENIPTVLNSFLLSCEPLELLSRFSAFFKYMPSLVAENKGDAGVYFDKTDYVVKSLSAEDNRKYQIKIVNGMSEMLSKIYFRKEDPYRVKSSSTAEVTMKIPDSFFLHSAVKEIGQLEKKVGELERNNLSLTEQNNILNQRVEKDSDTIAELKDAKKELQESNNNLFQKLNTYSKHGNFKKEIEGYKKAISTKDIELSKVKTELAELQTKDKSIGMQIVKELEKRNTTLDTKVKEVLKEKLELQNEINKLKTELEYAKCGNN